MGVMARGLPRLSLATDTAMVMVTDMARGLLWPAMVMAMDTAMAMARGLPRLSPAMGTAVVTDMAMVMARGLLMPAMGMAMVTATVMARGLPRLSPAMDTAMVMATTVENDPLPKYLHSVID